MRGKILVGIFVAMFLIGTLTPLMSNAERTIWKERKFKERRLIVPVVTEKGVEFSFYYSEKKGKLQA